MAMKRYSTFQSSRSLAIRWLSDIYQDTLFGVMVINLNKNAVSVCYSPN